MAILKFRIYWEDDDSVYRDVAILHTQSFKELHDIILKCFDFDNKHDATFFRSNDHWQKGRQIVLEKYDMVYKAEPLIMAETMLGSELRDPNQKFVYLYDFHKNWTFHVELININKEEDYKDYPYCVRAEGIGPSQYGTKGLVNEKLAEIEEKYDLNTGAEGFGREGEAEENENAEEEEESTGMDEDE